ncbi:MAG: hypothetical protein R3208_12560 [Ketobacteraceae bacterium]|nr:hypothetical protein [Ketobacteraceae bacterium]
MSNQIRKIHVYKDITQLAIDRALETSENIHTTIQNFILDMATGALENNQTVETLKAYPQDHVSRVYRFARDINRQVGQAISEMLTAYEHRSEIKQLADDT